MQLPGLTVASKRYPLLSLAFKNDSITAPSCITCTAIALIIPLLVCIGSWVDGTWEMSGNARGLSRHYGFWVQCATTPIIIITSAAILSAFMKIISSLDRYSISGVMPDDLQKLVYTHAASLCLQERSKFLLHLAAIIGGMWTVVNIVETSNPITTYGNKIFDSPDHPYGFLATKFFLLFNWALAYPIALFIAVHVTLSMVLVLRHMCSHNLLRIDFFHSDNCGGMSAFGTINLLIMGLYLNFFLVIASLLLTHSNHYFTLIFSAIVAAAVFLAQSFGAVYYIHRFAKVKKKEALESINKHLDKKMLAAVVAGEFSSDLLMARSHLLSIKTYPYTRQSEAIINIIRLSPTLLGLLKLVPHFP